MSEVPSSASEERARIAMAIADGMRVDWQKIQEAGFLPPEEIRALRDLEALRLAPRVPSRTLEPGQTIGDFLLVARIGQGGMGEVWEARQLSLARSVALKFVRPDRLSELQLALFAREARAGGRLNHPGLVMVHAHGNSDGLAWIAMELVRGATTLRDFLDDIVREGVLPEGYDQQVARFVAEVAEAMQTAHEAGVIHRDLKPQNLLVTQDDHPKVTDFGLARITDEMALSQSGGAAGTYLYMSPEQVIGKRDAIDARTDIFSLGVVLYELLTLRRPFEGDTTHQVAQKILSREPLDPQSIRSRIPPELAVIAGKALAKARGGRFQTMAEFAAELRRFLAGEPIRSRPPTPVERALKWLRRNPALGSAIAIFSLAFMAIASLLVLNVRTNRVLDFERTRLSETNSALEVKTTEAEASAAEAALQAHVANTRTADVLRLSALQRLEELNTDAESLWPARPRHIATYEAWLARAARLVAELPEHERKREELLARARVLTEEERSRERAQHPRFEELQRLERQIAFLRRRSALLQSAEPASDPIEIPPELAASRAASAWIQLALPMVSPLRSDWGREELGLALALHGVEVADGPIRSRALDALAWARLANSQLDGAIAAAEEALAVASGDAKPEFQARLDEVRSAVEELVDPQELERIDRELAELELRKSRLEAEVSTVSGHVFDNSDDAWWYTQLDRLVIGVRALRDPETGLLSDGISPERGWGIQKRLNFARKIAERSVSGPEARARWDEAVASIADRQQCPMYRGFMLVPQLGLLPIGRDPVSGLWEFADLQTGEPPARGSDGKLVLADTTSLVFVLLPGGAFWMGAQASDPSGRNFDPRAELDEAPVHEVVLRPYFLSKYEMTQGQWLRFAGQNPSLLTERTWLPGLTRSGGWSLLHPVEQITWPACAALLRRLGLELPTEAQWEFGARAGTTTPWWCAEQDLAGAGNVCDAYAKGHGGGGWGDHESWDDGSASHAPVGTYAANPFGLHETVGNVWEWCRDAFDPRAYGTSARFDPLLDDPRIAGNHVIRGGGFNEVASESRASYRAGVTTQLAGYHVGLRPARTIALADPEEQ